MRVQHLNSKHSLVRLATLVSISTHPPFGSVNSSPANVMSKVRRQWFSAFADEVLIFAGELIGV